MHSYVCGQARFAGCTSNVAPPSVVLRNCPTRNETAMLTLDVSLDVNALVYNGTAWGAVTEVSIDALGTRTTTVTFDKAGTYTFICHLPGHEAYGMTGTVTVTGG